MSLKPSIHWLFIFIPITVALEHAGGVPAPVVFFSAAISIIPIARLIVLATEQLSTRTGDAVGGLLNATFRRLMRTGTRLQWFVRRVFKCVCKTR